MGRNRMQQDWHNSVAFLKTCAKQRDLRRGSKIHADIVRLGLLEKDVAIGNTLVSMYCKCGSHENAQEVFNQLPDRNVVSWNAMIAGYTQSGLDEEALNLFDQMRSEGISPNAVTFSCVLKACGSLRATRKGYAIHMKILKEKLLENDDVLGNALVDMYAKSGLLEKAQKVFAMLPIRNVITWNVLIAGYVQHEFNVEALYCFEQMQLEGMCPNVITFVSILKACAGARAVCKGQQLHVDIIRRELLQEDIVVGNALVNMYVKSGMVTRARKVFDGLHVQDNMLWSVLIAGYAQEEDHEEALYCYQRMQHEGVSPDAVTLLCILKACSSIRAADKGQEVHMEIIRGKFLEKDFALGTALVDMYTKCGLLAEAHEVFDNVLVHHVVIWNSLIAGYVQHGHAEKALDCFLRMLHEGNEPDITTYISILKTCGSLGMAEMGEVIHGEVDRECLLEKDAAIGSALLDMYVRCGLLTRAHEVFDSLFDRNLIMYNSLIAGYAQQGHAEETMFCFRQMQCEGIPPNPVSIACYIKACSGTGMTYKGKEVHAVIVVDSMFEKDIDIGNALVDMYAKCALFSQAQKVLDRLPVRSVTSWNALLAGYAQHGRGEDAINCFEKMQLERLSPNAATFASILKACGSIGAIEKGRELHDLITNEQVLGKDVVVGNALVDMYAKCGLLANAQDVLDKLPVRSLTSWNALIAGHAEHGYAKDILSCYEQMQLEGITPNAITFAFTLKACGIMGAVHKGEELQAEIFRENLHERLLVAIGLVDMYAKCGLLVRAREVFDKIPFRNIVAWNVLIAGYAQHSQGEEALSCLRQVQLEGIYPNAVTFMCILKVCGSIGAAMRGQEIHAEILSEDLWLSDIILGKSLIDMYVKCGLADRAEELFKCLRVQDGVCWNLLITAYALLGKAEDAFHSLDQMMRDGIKPNEITFVSVLNACSHTGLLERGEMYFEAMNMCYGISPNVKHYSCMVDLYGRAGNLQKVVKVVKKMPYLAIPSIWHIVLHACREQFNMHLARLAFDHALELDKKDASVYVCMSNIFSDIDAGIEVWKGHMKEDIVSMSLIDQEY